MKLVIDSNRFMAALLKDASTRRLLISKSFKFFAPYELKREFEKYREELLKKSKLNEFAFDFTREFLLNKIEFINLDLYPEAEQKANEIMKEVDLKDAPFFSCRDCFEFRGDLVRRFPFHKTSNFTCISQ